MLEFARLFSNDQRTGATCRDGNASVNSIQMTRIHRVLLAILLLVTCLSAQPKLELTRAARSWEFLPVVGQRAALLGREDGHFEAWVYPVKLFRDLKFTFRTQNRVLPAESLARTVTVRPESATITYTFDTFTVRQRMFVPNGQPGAVIVLEAETREPLQISASFVPDFSVMWPASIGGTYWEWNEKLRAFTFGHEGRKFFGIAGSQLAIAGMPTTWLNYTQQEQSVMELPKLEKGEARYAIVVAASTKSADEARATYELLSQNFEHLEQESAKYYTDYLARTVALDLPDNQLEQAYDWARVSTIQGLVSSPLLGSGLVAGYKLSGGTQRPGFAWFFGRDSLWTDLALNSISDFATTRTALEFISKFQSKEGKLPHEISQSASLVDWDKLPYLYASADATPLYIIAFHDYVTASGDVAFAKEKWESIQRAYNFLRSTWDERGFPKNEGVGHGWVEGGPLLPVKTELYQSGLGWAAMRDVAELAKLTGNKVDVPGDLEQRRKQLNDTFWIADKNYYGFALRSDNSVVQIPSVEATVPLWFDALDPAKSEQMVRVLSREDHMADWGMRINSSREPFYDPQGYHYGAVWPLFTGWASVGEYKVHRPDAGYANLRANALLFDSPLGHFAEVLSGDYYTTISYASPHQIWSAAMVISPMLRGLFGLNVHALTHTVTLAPHLPYSWNSATVSNVKVGDSTLSFTIRRSASGIQLETLNSGKEAVNVEFSPAIGLRAQAIGADIGGRATRPSVAQNTTDQHAAIRVQAAPGKTTATLRVRDDFGLDYAPQLPPYGTKSQNLKILSQAWSEDRNTLTLQVEGLSGRMYKLPFFGNVKPSSLDRGRITGEEIEIAFPASRSAEYVGQTVTVRFAKPAPARSGGQY